MKTLLPLVIAALFFSPSLLSAPVNINSADASLLAKSLSGIGLHKAKAIVNYRQQHGLFNQPVDITHVKGIGMATYRRNKQDIKVK